MVFPFVGCLARVSPYVLAIFFEMRRVPHLLKKRLTEIVHIENAGFRTCPVRIIPKAVDVDVMKAALERQPRLRPKVLRVVPFTPCLGRPPSQAMHEDQVDLGFWRGVKKLQPYGAAHILAIGFGMPLLYPCGCKMSLDRRILPISGLRVQRQNTVIRVGC